MDLSGVNKYFPTANTGFITTTTGQVDSESATVVPLSSVAGLTNDSVFVGIINPGVSEKEQTFTGTVNTVGQQIENVVWTRGSNTVHAAGSNVVDRVTSTAVNMVTEGILKSHNQDGTLKETVMSKMYPVGSIYINASNAENPATLMGFGTWESFGAGRVLTGFDSSDSDFDAAQKTGGAKTHTLTTTQIPSHNHSSGSLTTNTTGAHSHNLRGRNNQGGDTASRGVEWAPYFDESSAGMRDAGAHSHSISGLTGNRGSGGSHPIMQPYITVYMWRRIS